MRIPIAVAYANFKGRLLRCTNVFNATRNPLSVCVFLCVCVCLCVVLPTETCMLLSLYIYTYQRVCSDVPNTANTVQ